MLVPGSANPLLLRSAAAAGGYSISRSLRFNSSDSASCSRSFTSAGNRRTWTLSLWVKRSAIAFSAEQHIWGVTGTTDATYGEMFFGTGDTLRFAVGYNTTYGITTTRVFRDPSAWYHIVLAFDATQSTAANKIKLYINGVEETTFSSDTRSSLANQDWGYNNNVAHYIGRQANSDIRQFNGYLADIHFIDGQALTPSSFTEVSATTGQLIPKAYTGSFGTNGFWLKFSDNSAATATTLGKDYSGNSNNWTPNNLSVTAGAGNDSLVDTPSSAGTDSGLGGQVTGNYCTWNPLTGNTYSASYKNGNLDFDTNGIADDGLHVFSTFQLPASGKWYWETTFSLAIGFPGINSNATRGNNTQLGTMKVYNPNGQIGGVGGSATWTTGDVIGAAYDADAGTLSFYKNGSLQPVSISSVGFSTGPWWPQVRQDRNATSSANFGQRPFAYTAPSGFKALCDTNLPSPLIAKGSSAMDVKLYTGNGSTQTISGLGFSPDLVWVKNRTRATANHALYDTVRGRDPVLASNTTAAELTGASSTQDLTSFNSDGFSLGTVWNGDLNRSTEPYVAWTWDAGTSTVTNTQGSITSSVRANASAGFSIVSYTGTGTSPVSVGHGLNVAPTFLIFKNRDDAVNWQVWTTAISSSGTILEGLNTTAAGTTPWTYVSTTSSLIQFNSGNSAQTTNGKRFICYAFSPVSGYSSFGSYTGNGSTDGPFVYTGFRPRWLLIKQSSASGENWRLFDTSRDPYNVSQNRLLANLSLVEGIGVPNELDILSNGFKLCATDSASNGSGATYIYAAFAEAPFNYARAR